MVNVRPIIFFGTDDFSAPSLQVLIDEGYDIAAVITKPDSKSGRGQKLAAPLVKQIAVANDITVWQPTRLIEISDDIAALGEITGVLVSYGKIIPQSIIDLFTPGIINIHPSFLPKYRGSSPIEAAILNGDEKIGISVMQLTAAMDAGPVYGFAEVPLSGTENQTQLYASIASKGAQVLKTFLPEILNNSCALLPQDESLATYTQKITKQDGVIDWNKSAIQIEREIRAYATWPQSHTTIGDVEVIITDATAAPAGDISVAPGSIQLLKELGILIIFTGDGSLAINKIKPIGKKEMPVQAFLAGYASRLV